MGFHRACFECELGKYKIRVTRTLFTKMDSECLLEKFVPVLLMKTKEVKRLKMTDKKVKRCGTTAARKVHFCDLCHYKAYLCLRSEGTGGPILEKNHSSVHCVHTKQQQNKT